MDVWMLVVTAVASLAAVASAVVAVVQARAAKQSQDDAKTARDQAQAAERETLELSRTATAAFIRQAKAQERANELQEEASRPPTWMGPKHVNGDLWQLINSSGRAVTVVQWEVDPDEAVNLVRITAPSQVFEYGDSFDFMYTNRLGIRPRKLIVVWRFTDEPDSEPQRFIVPL